MPLDTGDSLGPYKIIAQVGHGGTATVYKAYHESLDRDVAIKVIYPPFLEAPDFLARFQREERVVTNLAHDKTIPFYALAGDAKYPYLMMKLISRKSLKEHLAQEKMRYLCKMLPRETFLVAGMHYKANITQKPNFCTLRSTWKRGNG